MQKKTSVILTASIAALMVSFLAANSMLPTTFLIAQSNPPSINDKTGVLGHVTYVVKGPDGNIKSYRQTDNTRVVQGVQCSEFILFNKNTGAKQTTNATDACNGLDVRGVAGWNGFNVIALENGTSSTRMVLNGSDTYSTAVHGGTGSCGTHCGLVPNGLTNQGSPQIANSIAPGTTSGTYNQITLTSPSFAFSGLGSGGTTIKGSFLLNNTSTTASQNLMFAENTFTGGSQTVGNQDTLTVTWTITLT